MEKFISILLIFLFSSQFNYSQDYYYYQKEKISLQYSTNKIIVKFKKSISFEEREKIISRIPLLNLLDNKFDKSKKINFLIITKDADIVTIKKIILKLNQNEEIEFANPFYLYAGTQELGLTNKFIIKLKNTASLNDLTDLIDQTKTQIIRKDKYNDRIYILKTTKNSIGNALKMANIFYETGKFEFSEPNFIQKVSLYTNDQYYFYQWPIENYGQTGGSNDADIDGNDAWNITTGTPDIKIAVIDEGVDLDHPDLIENLLVGYDASGGGNNGGYVYSNETHGTQCAGIIAAKGNNIIGIAGIAYNCSIIPIRIDLSYYGFDFLEASNAMNWAWDDGQADVISNSWGNINFAPSSYLDEAINNAVTLGRNNLGSIVLFSSGNDESSNVSYPASNVNVIAVGATNNNDYRTDYSNYGQALDVVAPGGNFDIYTTTIGGYTENFSGTSASCPFAAGVVGLILSINSCLTQTEAIRILELSCDKVGAYCYNPGKPNGLWNNQMGYGRINAYKAVQYAFSLQTNLFFNVNGTDQGVSSQFDWILVSGGCSQLAAATYVVKRHEILATVSYPYTQAPILVGSANGFSAANPNTGNYFMNVVSVSPTNATVRTWVYEVITTISGQPLSWVPTHPSSVKFNFIILSAMSMDLYFQNQSVTSTEVHNAMNKIEAGYSVTNSVPFGDYILENGANVIFHAGNSVTLEHGFHSKTGSNFKAFVEPFFSCDKLSQRKNYYYNSFPTNYKKDESFIKKTNNQNTVEKYLIMSYPNPFTEVTTIEYHIPKDDIVTIMLFDKYGKIIKILKNKIEHKRGVYNLEINANELIPGIYFYTFQTDNFKKTKKFIKIH